MTLEYYSEEMLTIVNKTKLITNKTTEISKLPKYINTKTIKQKSLSYPQKTNQNDPKGSLKYVKFTFVKFLTQKVYEIACFI